MRHKADTALDSQEEENESVPVYSPHLQPETKKVSRVFFHAPLTAPTTLIKIDYWICIVCKRNWKLSPINKALCENIIHVYNHLGGCKGGGVLNTVKECAIDMLSWGTITLDMLEVIHHIILLSKWKWKTKLPPSADILNDLGNHFRKSSVMCL